MVLHNGIAKQAVPTRNGVHLRAQHEVLHAHIVRCPFDVCGRSRYNS
ncbi:MAG TPA: hypothetical protein VF172_13440 [Nitrososphaera sp.]|jgi:hypothetical protein